MRTTHRIFATLSLAAIGISSCSTSSPLDTNSEHKGIYISLSRTDAADLPQNFGLFVATSQEMNTSSLIINNAPIYAHTTEEHEAGDYVIEHDYETNSPTLYFSTYYPYTDNLVFNSNGSPCIPIELYSELYEIHDTNENHSSWYTVKDTSDIYFGKTSQALNFDENYRYPITGKHATCRVKLHMQLDDEYTSLSPYFYLSDVVFRYAENPLPSIEHTKRDTIRGLLNLTNGNMESVTESKGGRCVFHYDDFSVGNIASNNWPSINTFKDSPLDIEVFSYTLDDNLALIYLDITYRVYNANNGYVEVKKSMSVSSPGQIHKWEPNNIYNYYIYLNMNNIEIESEIIPWVTDNHDDLFYGSVDVD